MGNAGRNDERNHRMLASRLKEIYWHIVIRKSHGPDKAYGDISTHREAQAFFGEAGGPSSDPHRLDGDGDGVACESLP